jgi:hypothetical protein
MEPRGLVRGRRPPPVQLQGAHSAACPHAETACGVPGGQRRAPAAAGPARVLACHSRLGPEERAALTAAAVHLRCASVCRPACSHPLLAGVHTQLEAVPLLARGRGGCAAAAPQLPLSRPVCLRQRGERVERCRAAATWVAWRFERCRRPAPCCAVLRVSREHSVHAQARSPWRWPALLEDAAAHTCAPARVCAAAAPPPSEQGVPPG